MTAKKGKTVIFRVDSSARIGSGHLMRCLTLAGRIQKTTQAEIFFFSRTLPGDFNELIRRAGHRRVPLPCAAAPPDLRGYERWLTVTRAEDARATIARSAALGDIDLLVVDHYAIDETWEQALRPRVKKIMVIDDLADRRHDCDILLDQNLYRDFAARYQGLVPRSCRLLLGPRYALLREEFYEAQKSMRIRDGKIGNILVFFGGSDPTRETIKTLRAVERLGNPDMAVNVVVGGGNPRRGEIEEFCRRRNQMRFHCQVDYMAKLMNDADLAIGAGGSTIWERCFLGLPAVVIALADNQIKISEDCAAAGCICYLGRSRDVSGERIAAFLKELRFRQSRLVDISLNGRRMMAANKSGDLDIFN